MRGRHFTALCLSLTAVLVIATLFALSKSSSAAAIESRTYTGTNKCEVVNARDGDRWADMWCQGTYSSNGTCTGPPSHTRLFERVPGTCVNPNIDNPLPCNAGDKSAGFGYTCENPAGEDKGFSQTKLGPEYTVTCDPNPGGCSTPTSPKPSANCSWDATYCTWNCDYAGGGCTTPGWDGSCPYGTYPNNGMCCSSGASSCPGYCSASSFESGGAANNCQGGSDFYLYNSKSTMRP